MGISSEIAEKFREEVGGQVYCHTPVIPSLVETEAGGSLQVQGHPGLYGEFQTLDYIVKIYLPPTLSKNERGWAIKTTSFAQDNE